MVEIEGERENLEEKAYLLKK